MRCLVLTILLSLPAWQTTSAQPETFEYTVRRGDNCGNIAHRFYGDWRRYDVIMRHNPELQTGSQRGRCGPFLRPGVVLRLPRPPLQDAPDAELTQAQREVRTREPRSSEWRRANRGLDLFHGWRVNTLERSTAEITFRDRSIVQLRENTLVVVFGGSAREARRRTSNATLERGALRSRLGSLRMRVDTPSSQAELSGGAALVSVDEDGTSRVSNFDGGDASVSSSDGSASVQVRPGFGSKVRRAQRPSPPRRLPDAPVWAEGTRQFMGFQRTGVSLAMEWQPVESARSYRVELGREDESGVFAATEVDASVTRFEMRGFPAGSYWARVSTVDGDFFESRPSEKAELLLVSARVLSPGDDPNEELPLPDPSTPSAAPRVVAGSRVVLPEVCENGPEIVLAGDDSDVGCLVGETRLASSLDVYELSLATEGETRVNEESEIVVTVEGGEVPIDVQFEADGADVVSTARDGSAFTVTVVPRASEFQLSLMASAQHLASTTMTAEAVEAPTPTPRVEDEPDPEPVFARLSPNLRPELASRALSDRRTGFGVGVAYEGDGADGVFRLGVAAESWLYSRFGIHGRGVVDLDETTDGLPSGLDRTASLGGRAILLDGSARLGLGVDVWFSAARSAQYDVAVVPSLSLDVLVGESIRVRTVQGVHIQDERRLWVSSYGADVRLIGPLLLGAELGIGIGRTADELETLVHLGGGIGIAAGPTTLSLGARYGFTNDFDRIGSLSTFLALSMSI